MLATERGRASSSNQGLSESKARIESLMSKVTELESSNLKLNQKIGDLAQNIEDQNATHRAQVLFLVTLLSVKNILLFRMRPCERPLLLGI